MKTDNLFYELFRFRPASLFELVGLPMPTSYTFESITLKATEKRLDGLFRPQDGHSQNIFVEIQGYRDETIYWRLLREIMTWYEQTKDTKPFRGIVLFLDPKYAPAKPTWLTEELVISIDLATSLAQLAEPSVLTVLKPLVTPKKLLVKQVPQWQTELRTLPLTAKELDFTLGLLAYTLFQRLPRLTLEEINTMIRLTPIEQTVAGQQLIQIGLQRGLQQGLQQGRTEGWAEGEQRGELIGKITTMELVLKLPATPKKRLAKFTLEELQARVTELEKRLAS
jgi:predicted transposase YdaD